MSKALVICDDMTNMITALDYVSKRSAFHVISFQEGAKLFYVSRWCARLSSTYVDGAAQQRASLQSFADYPVQVSGSAAELVHLRHTTCKVLKPFCGAPS